MNHDEFFEISELPGDMRTGIANRKTFISTYEEGENALFFPTCALKKMSVKEVIQRVQIDFPLEDIRIHIAYREERGKVFFEKITAR